MLPCLQQETILIHSTAGSGFYMYKGFLLPANAFEGYYVFLLQVVAKNWKLQIDMFFLSLLHILAQEKHYTLRQNYYGLLL